MESRFGVPGHTQDGVYFTEAHLPNVTPCGHVRVELGRQNANLGAVKQKLAMEARARGANVLMNFRYGQRKNKWYEFYRWDTESWYGEGEAVQAAEGAPKVAAAPPGWREVY